mmetsp:Transcript_6417/g.18172  ORF Transcript_6417/g.18172 Transcript_6417/m.18172 type:complete len:519 (+) Transcript_6417:1046-2602(+)
MDRALAAQMRLGRPHQALRHALLVVAQESRHLGAGEDFHGRRSRARRKAHEVPHFVSSHRDVLQPAVAHAFRLDPRQVLRVCWRGAGGARHAEEQVRQLFALPLHELQGQGNPLQEPLGGRGQTQGLEPPHELGHFRTRQVRHQRLRAARPRCPRRIHRPVVPEDGQAQAVAVQPAPVFFLHRLRAGPHQHAASVGQPVLRAEDLVQHLVAPIAEEAPAALFHAAQASRSVELFLVLRHRGVVKGQLLAVLDGAQRVHCDGESARRRHDDRLAVGVARMGHAGGEVAHVHRVDEQGVVARAVVLGALQHDVVKVRQFPVRPLPLALQVEPRPGGVQVPQVLGHEGQRWHPLGPVAHNAPPFGMDAEIVRTDRLQPRQHRLGGGALFGIAPPLGVGDEPFQRDLQVPALLPAGVDGGQQPLLHERRDRLLHLRGNLAMLAHQRPQDFHHGPRRGLNGRGGGLFPRGPSRCCLGLTTGGPTVLVLGLLPVARLGLGLACIAVLQLLVVLHAEAVAFHGHL